MEIAGLAVGVVGLAGLFGLYRDTMEQIDTYKNYRLESRHLVTQFMLIKQMFRIWAEKVGIHDERGHKMRESHHSNLDNPEIASVVGEALWSIRKIFEATVKTSSTISLGSDGENLLFSANRSQILPKKIENPKLSQSSISKRDKLGWALGGKTNFAKQVDVFEGLVEKLYILVPIQQVEELGSRLAELDISLQGILRLTFLYQ
jgi:hypothetical protein